MNQQPNVPGPESHANETNFNVPPPYRPMGARRFPLVMFVILVAIPGLCAAQEANLNLTIEKAMTAQEIKDTGVSALSPSQRRALDAWLNRYTLVVVNIATSTAQSSRPSPPMQPSPPTVRSTSSCAPAIESTMSGEFDGWDGETIFRLDNGQIWEQAEYDYMYSYQYRPDVTIYETASGCRMKVEAEDETILVRRIH